MIGMRNIGKLVNLLSGKQIKSILKRNIATVENELHDRDFKEVEINVPWGKIAGKLWGSSDVEPIIALHGWQDNAGSFDALIKQLPATMSILAIDAIGHGYSSWLPRGMMYSTLVYVQMIERVKQYYGMEKFGMIGHSMGGMLAFNYTALFPNNVKFVVAFDYFKYPTYIAEKFLPRFLTDWTKFFDYERFDAIPPRHVEQEAINRYIRATENSLDEEMARTLLIRGATKYPDGTISFNRDPRVQLFLFDNGFTNEHLKEMASRIQCPYTVLKGEGSLYNEKKEFYFDVLSVIEKNSSDFRFHVVPGTHHFHMTNTRNIADLIGPFIQKYS